MATKSTKSASKPSSAPNSNNESLRKTKHDKPALAIIGLVVLFFFLLYVFKGLFVAASVNGEPISRFLVISALEKQGGKQQLESLVTKALIVQEAKKRNIVVNQSDIDKQIQEIATQLKGQGTTIDQALAAQGMTRSELNDSIRIQLYLQKMVGDSVKVTDKEVNDFVEQNKSQFPENTTEEAMRAQALAQLKQQKAQAATQQFIQNLQSNSKIIYFVKY